MALTDTKDAIGAVSLALKARIDHFSGIYTTIGHPSVTSTTTPYFNLFLYEISFDPHLKNRALNEGEKPPLWLVLKYLLTAFHTATDSDSENAHLHMGTALRALYTDDLLDLDGLAASSKPEALQPNPSPLHVTFDEAPSDLIAKLMQGPDDKFRLSACFQIRPVMIAASEPGEFPQLVGIDYREPPVELSDPYVKVDVIPSMGAQIDTISPSGFELEEEVTLMGTNMHLADICVMLGPVELPVSMQRPDQLRLKVDPTFIGISNISAGSHPVVVVQKLAGTGKIRKSNAVIGNLVPTLDTVTVAGPSTHVGPPAYDYFNFTLTGKMLGGDTDDTILAFSTGGEVIGMLDSFTAAPPSPPPGQLSRHLVLNANENIPDGEYFVILMVNGQQAIQRHKVSLNW